jgi:hypothetical protein
LRGSSHGESLDGGGGRDFISGRAGADNIVVGSRGHAIGGPGADRVQLRGVATIVCGADRDLVEELGRPDAGPRLARDCEQLLQGEDKNSDTPTGITVDPRARVRANGMIRLLLSCGDCDAGRVRVTAARRPFRLIAQHAFRLRPPDPNRNQYSATGTASVALSSQVAAAVRRRRTVLRFVLQTPEEHAVWTVRVGLSR